MKRLAVSVLAVVVLVYASTATLRLGWDRLWALGVTALTAGKTLIADGPPQLSVQKLSELVTLTVRLKTILTIENNWYKGIWEVEGEAQFGCDCGQAKWSLVDQEHKTITLRLPEPRVSIARVDHERTRLYDFHCITWNPACIIWGNPDAVREDAMKHAQGKLGNMAKSEENVSLAKQQAEYNLKGFYAVVGWKLTVEWI